MTEVTKRPSARFVPPPRPVLPSQPPPAPRTAAVAETLRARQRRPSARFGRVAAVAVLALSACGSDAPDIPTVPQSSCMREFWDRLPSQNLHLPLEVRISVSMGSERVRAIREAALWWNAEMHADVFDAHEAFPSQGSTECGVVTVSEAKVSGEPLAHTTGDDCSAQIVISNSPKAEQCFAAHLDSVVWTAAHELGHALNLPHDDTSTTNIMATRYSPSTTLGLTEYSKCLVATALSLADGDETRMSEFR